MADQSETPALRNSGLQTEKYEKKFVDETQKLRDKVHDASHKKDHEEKKPAGGFDSTPVPKAPPGYTLKITFHSAESLPFADISMTSDPYIHAVLKTRLPKRHKQDPDIELRTPTIHSNVNPVWNTSWIIAHVPSSGFQMKCRLYDEDPTDRDDRLGNVHVNIDRIDDSWKGFNEEKFKVKKRMGSKRAYTLRGCASLFSKNIKMSGTVTISVENLGRSEGESGGRAYTLGPLLWKQHQSPLIGRLAGTKSKSDGKDGKKGTERYNFQAIQMQLRGPVPEPLYHRYVEFKPFVAGMFTSHTLRGKILHHTLHHQHSRIYNYDTTTKYGEFEKPCPELASKFLEFVNYDQGGRIFTYVLTLDSQFRFTETGKEFGIDMLSKHTMHSDVSSYIAFSGEFFIRRLKSPQKDKSGSPDPSAEAHSDANAKSESKHPQSSTSANKSPLPSPSAHPTSSSESRHRSTSFFSRHQSHSNSIGAHVDQTSADEEPSKDPSHYELIIDNDSGTYRPNAKYLPELKKFFAANFVGLKVVTLDCQKDEEKMKKLKTEQAERKKSSGKQIMYMQNSSLSSVSSSDEEDLQRRVDAMDGQETGGGGMSSRTKSKFSKAKGKLGFGDDDYDDDTEKEDIKDKADGKNGEDHQNLQQGSHQGQKHDNATAPYSSTNQAAVSKNGNTTSNTQSSDHTSRAAGTPTAMTSNLTSPGGAALEKHHSISTDADADRASFNTAFTTDAHNRYSHEYGSEHFVTPKPSLGDGGLKQFDHVNSDSTQVPSSTLQSSNHDGNGDLTPKAKEKQTFVISNLDGASHDGSNADSGNGQGSGLYHNAVTSHT